MAGVVGGKWELRQASYDRFFVALVLMRYSGCAAPLQMTDNYPLLMCFNS